MKGNLVARPASLQSPALSLVWDFDNKLKGADTNGTPATLEVTYEYDALGRRVARSGPGGNVVYFQAGQQTIADYPRGGAPASATYRYVYGAYIDEPLLRETVSGSVRHFFHRNQQYSVTALTDSAGNTAERYAYTAYGALTVFNSSGTPQATSPLNNRYTYTGREWDDSTKLYHFRARWYDPAAGRFVGRDPLGFIDGATIYANYHGTRAIDPYGLEIFRADIVAKSFIYGIKNIGSFSDEGKYSVFWGWDKPEWNANTRLKYFAIFLKSAGLLNDGMPFNQNPETDIKDGFYRLYTRAVIDFECSCDNALTIISVKTDKEGGQEADLTLFRWYLLQKFRNLIYRLLGVETESELESIIPDIYGTIEMTPIAWNRIAENIVEGQWKGFGQPHALAEPGMQAVSHRQSKNIWHRPTFELFCRNGRGFYKTVNFEGSRFPSHRLWIDKEEDSFLPQGALSDLWISADWNDTFVK